MYQKLISLDNQEQLFKHFMQNSKMFNIMWRQIENVTQLQTQSEGVSVADHTRDVLKMVDSFIACDYQSLKEKTGLYTSTLQQIFELAKEATATDELRQFFTLIVMAHDFGKIHGNPGHQDRGVPYIITITSELGLGQDFQQLGIQLVKHHTLPGEVFLGESTPYIFSKTVDTLPLNRRDTFKNMLITLNLADILSFRGPSALFETNARYILGLRNDKTIQWLNDRIIPQRLERIGVSRFPKKLREEEEAIVTQESTLRTEELSSRLHLLKADEKNNVEFVLKNIHFHYTASLFPNMKPEAIMKFLEISGRFIIDFQTREHSNISKITIANDKKGKELSDFLLQGNDATTLFSVEGHTLYWQTNKI